MVSPDARPAATLDAIFKAYDVRGTVPDQLDPALSGRIGAAFARFVLDSAAGGPAPERVLVARDMRSSGVDLAAAFAEGVQRQGLDVVDLGLASTDLVYSAAGHLDAPGAMFTASHNPARYNGIKMCLAGPRPIGQDTGLGDIRRMTAAGVEPAPSPPGRVEALDLLGAFADHVRSFVDVAALAPLRVVADTANGMGGLVVPRVFETLPVTLEVMYGELDGSFPNHPADPIQPENLRDLQARVRETGADVGLAFDGDADRVFLVDDRGEPVSPSAITALVAVRALAADPGGTVIHNLITSRAVPEIVREQGGVPVRTRVGHSFIKEQMAATGAVFGGEHSAHYYFRDFWRADTGMLAAMHVLAELGASDRPLSALTAAYTRYASSGEVNSLVADVVGRTAAVNEAYGGRVGATVDHLDGLTVALPDGSWFNLRPSNTEPLLRLNVEAPDEARMAALRDDVLALVRD